MRRRLVRAVVAATLGSLAVGVMFTSKVIGAHSRPSAGQAASGLRFRALGSVDRPLPPSGTQATPGPLGSADAHRDEAKSRALTTDAIPAHPIPGREGPADQMTPEQTDAFVAAWEAGVPLPPSGSFSDIQWGQLEPLTRYEAEGYIEFNAMCHWYWAYYAAQASSGADASAVAERIIADIPLWPSFRGTAKADHAASVSMGLGRHDVEPLKAELAANCTPWGVS
jgi:hypothetical protein